MCEISMTDMPKDWILKVFKTSSKSQTQDLCFKYWVSNVPETAELQKQLVSDFFIISDMCSSCELSPFIVQPNSVYSL